jgi:hypothetical protein
MWKPNHDGTLVRLTPTLTKERRATAGDEFTAAGWRHTGNNATVFEARGATR